MKWRPRQPASPLAASARTAMRSWRREARDRRRAPAKSGAAKAPVIAKMDPRKSMFSVVTTAAGTYEVTDSAGVVVASNQTNAGAWAIVDRLDTVAGRDADRATRIRIAFSERA